MYIPKSINDPLGNYSFDDLEEEIKIEKGSCGTFQVNEKTENTYEFSVRQIYGKLSNRKKAPLFALIDWRGNLRYDLRFWKDNDNPSKGITFTKEELLELHNALAAFSFEAIYNNPIRQYKIGDSIVTFYHLIAKLSTSSNKNGTWQKEVNLIDWGCGTRVDFRKWTSDYQRHSRGIRIGLDELMSLKSIIETIF